jgi:hypothetical protein
MTSQGRPLARGLSLSLGVLLVAVATAAYLSLRSLQTAVDTLAARLAGAEEQLQVLAGEVTRFRIEQPAEGRGPAALLEKLRAYAPLLTSAATAAPEFKMAQQEMQAVLRAFPGLGTDGMAAIRARLRQLDPKADFDEVHWLIEAATRCEPVAGEEIAAKVLQGNWEFGGPRPEAPITAAPPRLRWKAADLLLRIDQPRAQLLLRQILLTESARGVDPDRAAAHNVPMLDPAAVAVTGFHNFVLHYLRSGDPETEETLLQVLQRPTDDVVTLQEVIEALGARKSARAVKRIEAIYSAPPGASENPLFLCKCLEALAAIRGEAARPFLEEELGKVTNEIVAKRISALLQDLGSSKAAVQPSGNQGTQGK